MKIVIGLLPVVCLPVQCAELSLPSVSTPAGLSVPLVLRFTAAGASVAALQFDLECDSALALTANAGSVALAAGKELYSASVSSRRARFLAVGLNRNVLDDGVVATIHASVSARAMAGVYPLRLTNVAASDETGNAVPLANRDGSLTVSANAAQLVSGVFPQIATGEGWKTSFSLLNLAGTPQLAKLTFWDQDGAALTVPLAFSGELGRNPVAAASTEVLVPANGLAVVETELSPSSTARVGWARVRAPAGVVGSAIFRYRLGEGRETEAIVPMETRAPYSFVMPYDNTNGFSTGVAMANDSDTTAASVAIIIRNAAGEELFTDSVALPVRGHIHFALIGRYPGLAGVRGSLECRDLNGGPIAVLGLRFNPAGSFTSIPAETRE